MFDLKQILEYPCYENIQKSYGFTMEELELALEGGPAQIESEVYEKPPICLPNIFKTGKIL